LTSPLIITTRPHIDEDEQGVEKLGQEADHDGRRLFK
jgi:hypothetical protein